MHADLAEIFADQKEVEGVPRDDRNHQLSVTIRQIRENPRSILFF
jgi:hypothetical protein